jgi:hypothetical protein
VERGEINMGESNDCSSNDNPHIEAMATNETWMLVSRFTGGPTGDSDETFYYAFPLDRVTGAAIAEQPFATYSAFDSANAEFHMHSDSRTLIALQVGDFDQSQGLASWQFDGSEMKDSPGSPIIFPTTGLAGLLPSGVSTYILFHGSTIAEWAVNVDGSLTKLAEASSPNSQSTSGDADPVFTDSGKVVLIMNLNRIKQHVDLVPYLHTGPAQLTQTPFEYVLLGTDTWLFKAGP